MSGRIAVAMSGGVDSSTAAVLLKEKGCDLVGFSMQLWDQKRTGTQDDAQKAGRCCSLDDLYDARAVALRLKFPYYVVNLQREFEQKVVRTFIENYRDGLTPSPCVLCNSRFKFDRLLLMAREVEATHVATGHYARVTWSEEIGRYLLLRGRDPEKDQSYYLFELTQDQLSRALFPLGELTKPQVREIARRHGLQVADKPDSQEICFVPDGDYAGFIERHYEQVIGASGEGNPLPGGDIIDSQGQILGQHRGIHHYTIGQRRGLGIAHSEPLYVIDIKPKENKILVGERARSAGLSCRVIHPNWISVPELKEPVRVRARIRSRHREASALVTPLHDGSLLVEFDAPQMAISPGQACVFYDGDRVLGGGWIGRRDDGDSEFPGPGRQS